jgi:hypothetical protein
VLDTAAPGAAVLVAPADAVHQPGAHLDDRSSELGATAECRVLVFGSVLRTGRRAPSASPAPCYALDLTGLGDGTYTLVVRLTDAAGNRGPETLSATCWTRPRRSAVGITGPGAIGNDKTPTWVLSSSSAAKLECRLTSAAGGRLGLGPVRRRVHRRPHRPAGRHLHAVGARRLRGRHAWPGDDRRVRPEHVRRPARRRRWRWPAASSRRRTTARPSWTFTLPPARPGSAASCRGRAWSSRAPAPRPTASTSAAPRTAATRSPCARWTRRGTSGPPRPRRTCSTPSRRPSRSSRCCRARPARPWTRSGASWSPAVPRRSAGSCRTGGRWTTGPPAPP